MNPIRQKARYDEGYVTGLNLSKLLNIYVVGRDAIRLVFQMLQGLEYLHSLDMVHRGVSESTCTVKSPHPCSEDLKPDNVFFASSADDSRVVIGDFGLSRILEDSKLSLLTHCGTLAVTTGVISQLPG